MGDDAAGRALGLRDYVVNDARRVLAAPSILAQLVLGLPLRGADDFILTYVARMTFTSWVDRDDGGLPELGRALVTILGATDWESQAEFFHRVVNTVSNEARRCAWPDGVQLAEDLGLMPRVVAILGGFNGGAFATLKALVRLTPPAPDVSIQSVSREITSLVPGIEWATPEASSSWSRGEPEARPPNRVEQILNSLDRIGLAEAVRAPVSAGVQTSPEVRRWRSTAAGVVLCSAMDTLVNDRDRWPQETTTAVAELMVRLETHILTIGGQTQPDLATELTIMVALLDTLHHGRARVLMDLWLGPQFRALILDSAAALGTSIREANSVPAAEVATELSRLPLDS